MINQAFADEITKIAVQRGSLLGRVGKKLGLLEEPADAAVRLVRKTKAEFAPSAGAQAQLKKMKLERQLAEMKRARGL